MLSKSRATMASTANSSRSVPRTSSRTWSRFSSVIGGNAWIQLGLSLTSTSSTIGQSYNNQSSSNSVGGLNGTCGRRVADDAEERLGAGDERAELVREVVGLVDP